ERGERARARRSAAATSIYERRATEIAGEGETRSVELSAGRRGDTPHVSGFDRVAHCYDETRGGEERGEEVAAWVDGLLGGPGTVLDVGVGTGLVAEPLVRRGRRVVGIDVSVAMLARAARRALAVARADA